MVIFAPDDINAAFICVREVAAAGARGGPGQAGRAHGAGDTVLPGDPRRGLDPMTTVGETAQAGRPARRDERDSVGGPYATARATRAGVTTRGDQGQGVGEFRAVDRHRARAHVQAGAGRVAAVAAVAPIAALAAVAADASIAAVAARATRRAWDARAVIFVAVAPSVPPLPPLLYGEKIVAPEGVNPPKTEKPPKPPS